MHSYPALISKEKVLFAEAFYYFDKNFIFVILRNQKIDLTTE